MADSSRTMRAVQYDKYGGGAEGLKHVEAPMPLPKKGEVLIRMEAASINPADWMFQNGVARPFMPSKFPFIPVCDLAGEVVELGSGVSNFKTGDKVISINFPGGGGLAEYAVAQASLTVARPPEVSAAEGACLPIAAVTALRSLKVAGVSVEGGDPKNVLVTAASGGVGHFAVQLARLAGHHVTATCGARNVGLVRSLGADEALDYGTPDGAALRSPSGRRYDAVVHCATGFPWSTFEPVCGAPCHYPGVKFNYAGSHTVLADAGVVVDITPGAAAAATALLQRVAFSKKRLVPLITTPNKEEMEFLVGMVRQGKLKAVIDSRYPLSRAQEGWAKSMEGHATGKVVVEMGGAE